MPGTYALDTQHVPMFTTYMHVPLSALPHVSYMYAHVLCVNLYTCIVCTHMHYTHVNKHITRAYASHTCTFTHAQITHMCTHPSQYTCIICTCASTHVCRSHTHFTRTHTHTSESCSLPHLLTYFHGSYICLNDVYFRLPHPILPTFIQ